MNAEFEKFADLDPMVLARYLSGEASRDERLRVERWVEADVGRPALIERLQAAWDRPRGPVFDPDDVVWQRVQRGMAPANRPPVQVVAGVSARLPARAGISRGGLRRGIVAAAFVTGALGVALLVTRLRPKASHPEIPSSVSSREIATRPGERLSLQLADGTGVTLNAESRLWLSDGLGLGGDGPREVRLQGEAAFVVAHDGRRPFRVRTSTAVAEDLGTEFMVSSYPEMHGTRVVVVSGAVAVRRSIPGGGGAAPVVLTLGGGDLGVIDSVRGDSVARGVDVRPYMGWVTGTLVFDKTPLGEAVPRLRRWYGIDLRLGHDALADQQLTATFHAEPFSQVLALLSMSLDLTIEQQGNIVTLRPRTIQGSTR